MASLVGRPGPDFTLPSTSGQDVRLSSYRGQANVLLAFFPLAFTSTCTAELCAFTEDFGRFANADTVVLPISVDSVPTLKEFKAKERISVELLSDFKRSVARAWGVLDEERFFARRSYFLVDRTGTVRWAHVEENNGQRRQDDELLEKIRSL